MVILGALCHCSFRVHFVRIPVRGFSLGDFQWPLISSWYGLVFVCLVTAYDRLRHTSLVLTWFVLILTSNSVPCERGSNPGSNDHRRCVVVVEVRVFLVKVWEKAFCNNNNNNNNNDNRKSNNNNNQRRVSLAKQRLATRTF